MREKVLSFKFFYIFVHTDLDLWPFDLRITVPFTSVGGKYRQTNITTKSQAIAGIADRSDSQQTI